MTWEELFMLDHYAAYVWAAYSLTLLVFVLNLRATFREKRLAKKIVARHYESQTKN